MLQSFPLTEGLDASDIDMLYVLAAAFMPSIVVLLLALFAHWLPDDADVLSRPCDEQHDHHRANDGAAYWRRAA